MSELNFTFRGKAIELIEEKNLYGVDSIIIFENQELVGSVEKLHKNEIHIVAQRILSEKYSYQEIGVYT
ncbi:hypothetical protein ACN0TX_12180 [Staphylococcus cohnii]|uniref:hypothetical protein n=1 Tax=Staphylococcus cohnii TaxID=29382 RepID=UPI003AF64614